MAFRKVEEIYENGGIGLTIYSQGDQNFYWIKSGVYGIMLDDNEVVELWELLDALVEEKELLDE